ncbi:MAG: tyrS1, partial [Paenibacillus sp.]|nr:tyrS1 [Paenibacillus sp.]
ETELVEALQDMPTTVLSGQQETGLIDLLVEAKAAPSRRQAKQDIESGAVYVNGERMSGIDSMIGEQHRLHGKYVVLRRGKKNYYLIKVEA